MIDKDIINRINEKIIQRSGVKIALGLEDGKLGMCIYLFKLSELSSDLQYRKHAENVFDEICEELSLASSTQPVSELIKIGIGINYLFECNYIAGNINEILGDFDDIIFLELTSNSTNSNTNYTNNQHNFDPFDLIPSLYYILIRLEKLKKGSDSLFMMEELSIKILNDLYVSLNSTFFEAPCRFSLEYRIPLLLCVLSKMYSLKFYNYRLDEIFNEISYSLLSKIPALHSNRLYLLLSLFYLREETQLTFWDEQIEILINHIDFQKIIYKELKNRNVFIKDGISGIYLLLLGLDRMNCRLLYNRKWFIQKIENSDIWKENNWAVESLGLMTGLSGLLLVYYLIEKEINENES